jgi:hypothetical protein
MRWSRSLFALAILGVSGPALAEQGNDAPGVTVLRGESAPPPPAPPVIVQPVVVPEFVYVPTNSYPAYPFYYPGFFIQSRRFVGEQFPTTGVMRPPTTPASDLSALRPVMGGSRR